jgi:hypothetical protein
MKFRVVLIAAIALSLAACGGGGRRASNTASPAASPAAAGSPGAYGSQKGAASMGTAQPVPSMDCGGTQPVWVNERSRVFHLAGDPYYGRTKHGKYMCERDAAKAGYHPSKM